MPGFVKGQQLDQVVIDSPGFIDHVRHVYSGGKERRIDLRQRFFQTADQHADRVFHVMHRRNQKGVDAG